ncbi:hypothetical protein D3C75_1305610 [compost metagenome]
MELLFRLMKLVQCFRHCFRPDPEHHVLQPGFIGPGIGFNLSGYLLMRRKGLPCQAQMEHPG